MSQTFTRRTLSLGCGALTLALSSPGTASALSPQVEAVPGRPTLLLGAFELAPLGYSVEEVFLSGDATSYALPQPPASDGRWNAQPARRAPYVTRMVVVRPRDPSKFNGTVVVEWLNVTGGGDVSPDWHMAHRELIRSGFAWVGVSAQKVGVEGGPNLVGSDHSLKKTNPTRYGKLSHPGDAFAYDIFSQAGRAVRTPGVLGPLKPDRIIAAGESQSAGYLTTYINAVDPLAKAYDGFFVHSRFGTAARLDGVSTFEAPPSSFPQRVRFRTDLRAPVMTVITETDLLGGRLPGYFSARQKDNPRLRVWEIAGTAHADNYSFRVGFIDSGSAPLEKLAAAWAPTSKVLSAQAEKPVNFGPQHHYVVQAALAGLDRWVRTGQAPPHAQPIAVKVQSAPEAVRDGHGVATGGVRSPWVDVPTARLAGVGNSGPPMVTLFGVGEPFDAAKLKQLYPGGEPEYLQRFEASLDAAIRSGFILAADRQEILDLAAISYEEPH